MKKYVYLGLFYVFSHFMCMNVHASWCCCGREDEEENFSVIAHKPPVNSSSLVKSEPVKEEYESKEEDISNIKKPTMVNNKLAITPFAQISPLPSSADPENLLERIGDISSFFTYPKNLNFECVSGDCGTYSVMTRVKPVSVRLAYDADGMGKKNDILYYFWVGQDFTLTPNLNAVIKSKRTNSKGHHFNTKIYWVLAYDMGLMPTPGLSNVHGIQSSPETTVGSTTISSSVSTTFSGSVGFFGNTPTGDVSGSYSLSHSESRTILDVEVDNISKIDESGNYGTNWLFKLKAGSPISKNTMQPYVQALWWLNKDDRNDKDNFSIRMTFTPVLFMGDGLPVEARTCEPPLYHDFTVEFPPDPL